MRKITQSKKLNQLIIDVLFIAVAITYVGIATAIIDKL
jgi:hypothetical protein